ncbi:MAG: hypothetical protein DWH79_00975 [Planctomycetota bacterium]|nr:MAG: hypothetical protein DWH79_00975 [Planctomycetota bacterium]
MVPVGVRRPLLLHAAVLIVASAGLLGCSGRTAKLPRVTGKVTVDGAPADGASLLFFTPGQQGGIVPSANCDASGAFEIISSAQPGIALGTYKVTVVWPDPAKRPSPEKAFAGNAEDPPDLLGGRYGVSGKSPLTAEITAATKQLPVFELSAK